MMKKITSLLLIAFISGMVLSAQELRINGYSAYAFNDGINSVSNSLFYFTGKMKGGYIWGGGLEYKINDYYGFEVVYQRLDSRAPLLYDNGTGGVQARTFDYGLNYIMLASNRYMPINDVVEAYGGLMGGAAVLVVKNPLSPSGGSATRFGYGARLGTNVYITDFLSLKLQIQLMSVVQGVAGGVYFGTGGIGSGFTSYSSLYQFNIGGGFVFKFY